MKKLLLIPLLLSSLANAKTLIVAVIDSGIDKRLPHLCKMGHKSFISSSWYTSDDPNTDTMGHGTHVAGLINRNAGNTDYCLVSLKYYDPRAANTDSFNSMLAAIKYAINIKVDVINISAGGGNFNKEEYDAIELALNNHILVVAAAGNEHTNLDAKCDYFPACYDKRVIMVGNLNRFARRAPSSNYGSRVNRWEIGTDCLSDMPEGKTGIMTGTSQATAIATGKLIKTVLAPKRN